MEIINTGDLRRLHYENTPDIQAIKLFNGIYNVGEFPSCLFSFAF
jgi:DNA polymerase lambda